MAKIERVNYDAMPGQAKEMRGYAKQLNSEITQVYASVGKLHDLWQGKRYNELVKAFNNIIPQLNEMLTVVVSNVPTALEEIANNYSLADRGEKATIVSNELPNKITNLTITNDLEMKCLTDNVLEVQKSISTNFTKAKDLMSRIESVYAKISWQSEAAEDFKNQFTKLKNDIVASFENVNTQFVKLVQQAQHDIDMAEKLNKVN